jgi:hypothetical protein
MAPCIHGYAADAMLRTAAALSVAATHPHPRHFQWSVLCSPYAGESVADLKESVGVRVVDEALHMGLAQRTPLHVARQMVPHLFVPRPARPFCMAHQSGRRGMAQTGVTYGNANLHTSKSMAMENLQFVWQQCDGRRTWWPFCAPLRSFFMKTWDCMWSVAADL